jgi:serine/threonine protein kinase
MNRWRVRNLAEFVPMLDSTGLDLLTKMLVYAPHRRITCQAALQHAWFSDIPEIMSKVGCV